MKKFNQNSIVNETEFVNHGKDEIAVNVKVVTTKTHLFIYRNEKLVGPAAVKRPEDFNYDALLKNRKEKHKFKSCGCCIKVSRRNPAEKV